MKSQQQIQKEKKILKYFGLLFGAIFLFIIIALINTYTDVFKKIEKVPSKKSQDAGIIESVEQAGSTPAQRFTDEIVQSNSGFLQVSAEFGTGALCNVTVYIDSALYHQWKAHENQVEQTLLSIWKKASVHGKSKSCVVQVNYQNARIWEAKRTSVKSSRADVLFVEDK